MIKNLMQSNDTRNKQNTKWTWDEWCCRCGQKIFEHGSHTSAYKPDQSRDLMCADCLQEYDTDHEATPVA
jgi:hypothetical protein